MNEAEIRSRLIDIEMALDHQAKQIEDLSDVVIKQGKIIDRPIRQTEAFKDMLQQDIVKPLSEETPPPHY